MQGSGTSDGIGGRILTISFTDQDEGAIMEMVNKIMNQMQLDENSFGSAGRRSGIRGCRFHTNSENVGVFGMAKGLEWRERKLLNFQREMNRRLNLDLEDIERDIELTEAANLADRKRDLERRRNRIESKRAELESRKVDLWKRKSDFEKGLEDTGLAAKREVDNCIAELENKKRVEIQKIRANEEEEMRRLDALEGSLSQEEELHRIKMKEERNKSEDEVRKMEESYKRNVEILRYDTGDANAKMDTLKAKLQEAKDRNAAEREKALKEINTRLDMVKSEETAMQLDHEEKLEEQRREFREEEREAQQRIDKERAALLDEHGKKIEQVREEGTKKVKDLRVAVEREKTKARTSNYQGDQTRRYNTTQGLQDYSEPWEEVGTEAAVNSSHWAPEQPQSNVHQTRSQYGNQNLGQPTGGRQQRTSTPFSSSSQPKYY